MLTDDFCVLQWMHRTEVYITRGAEGRTGKYIVGNMSEDRALELSAKVVSEAFVFSVSFGGYPFCTGEALEEHSGFSEVVLNDSASIAMKQ